MARDLEQTTLIRTGFYSSFKGICWKVLRVAWSAKTLFFSRMLYFFFLTFFKLFLDLQKSWKNNFKYFSDVLYNHGVCNIIFTFKEWLRKQSIELPTWRSLGGSLRQGFLWSLFIKGVLFPVLMCCSCGYDEPKLIRWRYLTDNWKFQFWSSKQN